VATAAACATAAASHYHADSSPDAAVWLPTARQWQRRRRRDAAVATAASKYKVTVGTLLGKGNVNSSKGNGTKERQRERPKEKDQRLSTADRQQRQDGVPQGAAERWTAPCSASTVSPIAHAIPVISKQFRIYAGSILPSSIVLIGGLILEPAQRVPGQYALAVDAPAAYCHWSSDSQDTPAARALHPDRFVATYTCNRSNGALLHSLRGDFGSALLTWAPEAASRHLFGVTACVAPVHGSPSSADLRAWLALNLLKHVDRFALYVRSESLAHVQNALRWYISSRIVSVHDAGPMRRRAAGGISWRNNTERYDAADLVLHAEYDDQVLWLAACQHTYGASSRRLLSLDIDEVLTGSAGAIEDIAPAGGPPLLLPTVAFGGSSSADCRERDAGVDFLHIFTRRQQHSIPPSLGWPRTKLLSSPPRILLQWIHQVFNQADACGVPAQTVNESELRIAHFVDLNVGASQLHGGQCRCDAIHPMLPCNVSDLTLASLAPAPLLVSSKEGRFLLYVERDGLNNQLIALRHACWLGTLTNRTVVVPDWVLHHRQASDSPTRRVALCDAIDCTRLRRKRCEHVRVSQFDMPPRTAVHTCRGVACLTPSDAPVLHLPNKVAFQLGLQEASYAFTAAVSNLHDPVAPSMAVRSLAKEQWGRMTRPFLVAHARHVGHADYDIFGNLSARVEKTVRVLQVALDQLPGSPSVLVISNDCRAAMLTNVLSSTGFRVQCADSDPRLHPHIESLVQQWLAVCADGFAGDEMSTVSQNILRWRHERGGRGGPGPRMDSCNPSWCTQVAH